MIKIRCRFIPQQWVNDTAIPSEPLGETHWEMFVANLPEPFSYESDDLLDDPAAPMWCRDWEGPFEVAYEVIE